MRNDWLKVYAQYFESTPFGQIPTFLKDKKIATPIGHTLAGYLVYRFTPVDSVNRRVILFLCLFLAVAPDLDFIPGIIEGQPALYHQGISHSFFFALTSGFFLSTLINIKRTKLILQSGLLLSLAYASHLIIDMVGPDKRLPYGIPLFWPISSETYHAPFQIFLGVRHAHSTFVSTNEWIATILQSYNLLAISLEIVLILPLVFLIRYLRPAPAGAKREIIVKEDES